MNQPQVYVMRDKKGVGGEYGMAVLLGPPKLDAESGLWTAPFDEDLPEDYMSVQPLAMYPRPLPCYGQCKVFDLVEVKQ